MSECAGKVDGSFRIASGRPGAFFSLSVDRRGGRLQSGCPQPSAYSANGALHLPVSQVRPSRGSVPPPVGSFDLSSLSVSGHARRTSDGSSRVARSPALRGATGAVACSRAPVVQPARSCVRSFSVFGLSFRFPHSAPELVLRPAVTGCGVSALLGAGPSGVGSVWCGEGCLRVRRRSSARGPFGVQIVVFPVGGSHVAPSGERSCRRWRQPSEGGECRPSSGPLPSPPESGWVGRSVLTVTEEGSPRPSGCAESPAGEVRGRVSFGVSLRRSHGARSARGKVTARRPRRAHRTGLPG